MDVEDINACWEHSRHFYLKDSMSVGTNDAIASGVLTKFRLRLDGYLVTWFMFLWLTYAYLLHSTIFGYALGRSTLQFPPLPYCGKTFITTSTHISLTCIIGSSIVSACFNTLDRRKRRGYAAIRRFLPLKRDTRLHVVRQVINILYEVLQL